MIVAVVYSIHFENTTEVIFTQEQDRNLTCLVHRIHPAVSKCVDIWGSMGRERSWSFLDISTNVHLKIETPSKHISESFHLTILASTR